MRIGIISQARMTSTRLPGKVLLPAAGQPLLAWHVQRLRETKLPVFLAITTNTADDVLADFAAAAGLAVTRGDEHDVLSRYHACATTHGLDAVVRVTSDCPLIAPELVAEGAAQYQAAADTRLYLSNALVRTFPRGFDFEIFSAEMLAEAHAHATRPEDREHVTPYLHQNRPGTINFTHFTRSVDASAYRLTVDTADDYELVRTLLEDFRAGQYSGEELIALLDARPELALINAHIEQKKL
jgi:spore coat polysaccharide biosynthesis protein SpsF